MSKHDLDAALKMLETSCSGRATAYEVLAGHVRAAFRAYHDEPEQPALSEAAVRCGRVIANTAQQAEPRIEAGAVVHISDKVGHTWGGYSATVIGITDQQAWVSPVGYPEETLVLHKSWLTVTTPATPEPGDYVQHRDGRTGHIIMVETEIDSSPWYGVLLGDSHEHAPCRREEFTILTKAPKKEQP